MTILAVGSVHSPGSLSRCGPLRSPGSFQRAAALAFAVERANAAVNSSSLSALLLDDCSRPARAIYQTFGFLSEQNGSVVSNPDTVALALLMDSHNVGLTGLLDSQGIPHVAMEDESAVTRARLNAALGVARDLGWSRVALVRRQESSWGRRASDMLISEILPTMRTMCLGGELVVDLSSEDLSKELQPVVNNPLLLLFETVEETKQVLDALSELRHRPRVIIASGWDSSVTYNNTMDADVFTVGQDLATDVVPGFREFVTSTVTANSGSVPSEWSAEFLDGASSAKWQQASGVSDIVRIVEWVAEEVQRLCYQDEDTPLCGQDPQAFRDEIQATLTAKMSAKAPNLAIWRLNGTKSYDRVGRWRKEAGLNVDVRTWRRMDVVECESLRVGRSGKLTLALDEAAPPSSLLGELRTLWGVVCAALSVLGALLTVALLVFFASSTHKVAGTSVLGFLILFGVLMLYGSTLAFLVSPSPVSCLVKRLLPGLAYAVVIAGMLLKVRHYCKQIIKRSDMIYRYSFLMFSIIKLLYDSVN